MKKDLITHTTVLKPMPSSLLGTKSHVLHRTILRTYALNPRPFPKIIVMKNLLIGQIPHNGSHFIPPHDNHLTRGNISSIQRIDGQSIANGCIKVIKQQGVGSTLGNEIDALVLFIDSYHIIFPCSLDSINGLARQSLTRHLPYQGIAADGEALLQSRQTAHIGHID